MKRGEIYYINKNEDDSKCVGSEQWSGRPAIIVSNDLNNEHSSTVEVVYLTTKPKKNLPTHVMITSSKSLSIALCEQITTVSMERVGDYCGECTEEEMDNIAWAMAVSIGIANAQDDEDAELEKLKRTIMQLRQELTACSTERDVYERMYNALLAKMMRKERKRNDG